MNPKLEKHLHDLLAHLVLQTHKKTISAQALNFALAAESVTNVLVALKTLPVERPDTSTL